MISTSLRNREWTHGFCLLTWAISAKVGIYYWRCTNPSRWKPERGITRKCWLFSSEYGEPHAKYSASPVQKKLGKDAGQVPSWRTCDMPSILINHKNELKECQQQSWESSKDLYKVPYLIFTCNRLPTPFLSFQKHLGQGPKAPRLTKGIFNKASTSGPTLHETWQVGKIMVILDKYPCKYMCISKEVDIHSYIHTFIPSSIHPFMHSCLHAFVLSYLHKWMKSR